MLREIGKNWSKSIILTDEDKLSIIFRCSLVRLYSVLAKNHDGRFPRDKFYVFSVNLSLIHFHKKNKMFIIFHRTTKEIEGKMEKITNSKSHQSAPASHPTVVDVFSMEVATPEFVNELSRLIGDQKLNNCYECIKCTSGCTAAWLQPEYRPHQIINIARLGFRNQLLSSKMIWNCTTCSYCREICPQNVCPVDVVKAVRRIAVKAGQILEEHRKICEFLLETGHIVPINEKYIALRNELGLQPTPPTTHTYPNALKEIKEILSITGFTKLVGRE